jgi:hypothetical protein
MTFYSRSQQKRCMLEPNTPTANLLSIDVDDYVLVCFAHYNTKTSVDSSYKTNIDYQIRYVLDLLSDCNCKATFFICTFLLNQYERTL